MRHSASLLALAVLLVSAAATASETEPGPAPAPSSAATSQLGLPLVVEGQAIGEAQAEVAGLEVVALDARSLAQVLDWRINPETRAALQVQQGSAGVDALAALGIGVVLNRDSLTLEVTLGPNARAAQEIALRSTIQPDGSVAVRAAGFAAGMTGSLQYLRSQGAFSRSTTNLDLSGFANMGGKDGVYLLYGGSIGLSGGHMDYRRDRIVAFHDDVNSALRYSAGDLYPILPSLVGDIQLAGLSIERNYQEIQPLRNVRPTGQRSFRVERPSRVEIYSNGALLRTLEVQPGVVDLRSLPAIGTTSNISIVVEDSFGRREIDAFTLSSEIELLATGLSEFNLSAGLLLDDRFGSFRYGDDPVAAGFYRRGVSEGLTLGAHLAAAESVQNLGADSALLILGGLLTSSLTASHGDSGSGAAVLVEYRGDPFGLGARNAQLNLRAEGRSRQYENLGSFGGDRLKLDAFAEYRFDLTEDLGMSLGASIFDRYDEPGSIRSVYAGLQASLGRAFVTATGRYATRPDGGDDSGVLLTLSLPLGRMHFVSANVDSGTGRSRVEFRKRRDFAIPDYDYSGFIQHAQTAEEAGARARFANSRFEVEGFASHLLQDAGDTTSMGLRTQAGIAYADGTLAIGRDPGRGFALVKKSEALGEARVDVFGQGSNRRIAQANALGPAVVPQVSPYRPDIISVGIIGDYPYADVGPGEYQTDVGAGTGHVIDVGNNVTLSGIVRFLRPDGSPLAARYGYARRPDGSQPEPIFTTSEGRAFIANLRAGTYVIEFDNGRFRASIDVPAGSEGQIDLGQVTMQEGSR